MAGGEIEEAKVVETEEERIAREKRDREFKEAIDDMRNRIITVLEQELSDEEERQNLQDELDSLERNDANEIRIEELEELLKNFSDKKFPVFTARKPITSKEEAKIFEDDTKFRKNMLILTNLIGEPKDVYSLSTRVIDYYDDLENGLDLNDIFIIKMILNELKEDIDNVDYIKKKLVTEQDAGKVKKLEEKLSKRKFMTDYVDSIIDNKLFEEFKTQIKIFNKYAIEKSMQK